MKASELIGVLLSKVEQDGDLEVVVCGLDGAGYVKLAGVQAVSGVPTPTSVVCEFCPPGEAERMGADPTKHERFLYLQ